MQSKRIECGRKRGEPGRINNSERETWVRTLEHAAQTTSPKLNFYLDWESCTAHVILLN